MELLQAIELIKAGSIQSDQATAWADLGCGKGLFTLALMHLLHPGSRIYAVDKNQHDLNHLKAVGNSAIQKINADFIQDELDLYPLDGLLMANSLHFVKDKVSFLHKIRKWLKPEGMFLILEYDMDVANPWVPYPISFTALSYLFKQHGYSHIEKLAERPSIYNRAAIYSALITQ